MKIDHIIDSKSRNRVTELVCSGVNHNLTVFFCISVVCMWCFFGVSGVFLGFGVVFLVLFLIGPGLHWMLSDEAGRFGPLTGIGWSFGPGRVM